MSVTKTQLCGEQSKQAAASETQKALMVLRD